MAELGIGQVLDLDQLQVMLQDFSEATGLATVVVDTRGVPVTPPCAFTEFCDLMRADPARHKLCHACDAHGGLQALIEGSPQAYRCHSGLVDFSVPVTEGDKYVGAILCGQVRVPESEQPDFLTSHSVWQADPRLRETFEQVPISSLRRIAAAAKTLQGLSRGAEARRESSRAKLPVLDVPPRSAKLPEPSEASVEAARTEVVPLDSRVILRDAIDAEDLAGAYRELTRLLDEAYRLPVELRAQVAALEDLVLAVAKDCAPRLVAHLSQVVERQRARRTSSVNRYQSQLYLERLLGSVLDEVVRSRPSRRRDLRDLLNEIARHPNRALSLTEAAAATHWSPGHLSKLFKSVTGDTFVSYVTASRISRAALMLASTQMPVQKIAADLEFNQVNYFSRVFRAHTGHSPSEYRRQFASSEGRPASVPLPTHHFALLRA